MGAGSIHQWLRRSCYVAALALATTLPSLGHAQGNRTDQPLLYAGFAFSGNYGHRQDLYPNSAEISEKDKPGLFDNLLREKLRARPYLAARVSLDKSDGKTDTTSVAFAIVQENVELQKIDGKFWVVVLMQANVLAFNQTTKSVVASYPLRMRFSRVLEAPPSPREIKAIVMEAYTSPNPSENIFEQWLNKLETVKIKAGATKYLRVTEITVTPEAERVMQASGVNVAAIKAQVANFLEASVSEKAGVPIVPNVVGEAIGNKMALRFSSSTAFSLNLPEADYAITFSIRDFVSKKIEKAEYFQDIFRSKASLAIKLPDTGKTYLDENIYDTLIVTRPKLADVQIKDWDQYYKTLQQLIASLGKQFVAPDDQWLKEHAARESEAKPAFLQAKQLMQELQ